MMVSNISFSGVSSTLRTNEDAKEKILFTMQIAVKEIQYYCSVNNVENGLSASTREVHQLCDSLDKTLFHGLREYQKGYWPIVKEFTHSNIVAYIEGLEHTTTEIQCGRTWLCLALNESSFESYFRSFQQNPNLIQKHYSTPAFLRDQQRMELVLMLMAGLENVPINLNLETLDCGSGLSFFSSYLYRGIELQQSNYSSDIPMYEYCRPNSESSFRDDDSGVIECENTDNTDGLNLILDDSNESKNEVTEEIMSESSKPPILSENEFERITKYLNLSPESEVAPDTDLEVIRTKVVRRFKKPSSQKNNLPEVKKRISCPENLSRPENTDTFVDHRLSKATADSGLSLETHSSSDRDSPELTYECFNQKMLSFDIDVLHTDIAVKFSTPSKQKPESFSSSDGDPVSSTPFVCTISDCVEERGAPEGQEAPAVNSCSQSIPSRLPLQSGNDGLDDEEEFSIYDLAKNSNLFSNSIEINVCRNDEDGTKSEISSSLCSTIHATPDHCVKPAPKPVYKDPVDDELLELMNESFQEKLDIRVDDSTLLYLLVEVFEHAEESFYKMFHCYLHFPKGNDQISLLLLTNKCLYVLEPGNAEQKFILHESLAYSNINCITVFLNYQGFTILTKNFKQMLKVFTADEYLTRSIISNLEVAIRRSTPKQTLPALCINGSVQICHLKKFLASQIHCSREDIALYHFVFARWEDYNGTSLPDTPGGPRLEGSLMYRHKYADSDDMPLWQPGYFVLNAGVLYCMEEGDHSEPLFFFQIWVPHCKGCRRLHPPVRPYAFEVIISNGDSLQLAAADEADASKWQQAFLQTVSLAGHLIDCNSTTPRPCCVIVFNDNVSVLEEMTERTLVKCIGMASIGDIVAVCTYSSVPTCLYMEFSMVEADKSCGEWIILFETENEKEKFLSVLRWRWSLLFQTDLKVSSAKDLSLVTKIQQIAHNGEADQKRIHEFCYES